MRTGGQVRRPSRDVTATRRDPGRGSAQASFFLYSHCSHRDLHSFPTRRSSDLLSQGQWTMPVSNQLLLEANATWFRYNPTFGFPPPDGITNLIPVQEQSAALACTNANPALRAEEHTSALQSRLHLVCLLLLEKK